MTKEIFFYNASETAIICGTTDLLEIQLKTTKKTHHITQNVFRLKNF